MSLVDESVPVVWLDESGAHCTCGWHRPLTPPTDTLNPSLAAHHDLAVAEIHTEYCTVHLNHLHDRIDALPDILGEPVSRPVLDLLHGLVRGPVVHIRRELARWLGELSEPWDAVEEDDLP